MGLLKGLKYGVITAVVTSATLVTGYTAWSMQRDTNYELNDLSKDRVVIAYQIKELVKKGQYILELDVLNPNRDKVLERGEKLDNLESKVKKGARFGRMALKLVGTVAPESKVGQFANKADAKIEDVSRKNKAKIAKYNVLKEEQSQLEKNWAIGGAVAGYFTSLVGCVLVSNLYGAFMARRREDDELVREE
jgi:hypothetical protein